MSSVWIPEKYLDFQMQGKHFFLGCRKVSCFSQPSLFDADRYSFQTEILRSHFGVRSLNDSGLKFPWNLHCSLFGEINFQSLQ